MYDLQVYIDEWQSYILSLGLPFDLNPLDSPLFRAWMAANYPSVPLGGGGTISTTPPAPAPAPPRPPVSNNTMLLAGAAFLAFVFFTGKKR